MSVELRMTIEGHCECGIPHHLTYKPECNHRLVCEWGVIEYGDPRPYHFEVGHLILVAPDYLRRCLTQPQKHHGGWATARIDGERIFMTLEHPRGSWTWELFETHWWDNNGPEILVGRWPD